MNAPGTNPVDEAWRELSSNNWQAAKAHSERALAASLECAPAWHTLALAQWGLSDLPGARQSIQRAADLDPKDAHLWSDFGVLAYAVGDWAVASEAFRVSVTADPLNLTALRGYADSLLQLSRVLEAREAFERCLAAYPDHAQILRSLATCFLLEQKPEQALAAVERSLVLEPSSERGLTLLATILQNQKRYERSLQACEALASRQPTSFAAQARLAIAHWEVGDIDRALGARQQALALPPNDRNLHASLSWITLHDPNQTAAGLLQAHRDTADAWAGPSHPNIAHCNNRDKSRRLRVGYLSGEFVSNPVSCFFLPWLPLHDKREVETFYYMSRGSHDTHTRIYQHFADHWLDVCGMTDDAIAARIAKDEIDILVDLSGHFGENRLGVFARRPAPVQVTYPNYPSTTGMRNIDYIFTDRWTSPVGCEGEYSETPYRLPSGYLVFQLPLEIQPRTTPPMWVNGHVTFGIFQRPSKYNDSFWDAVGGILAEVSGSRLLVHFASAELDEPASPQRDRVLTPLAERGIEGTRVSFRGTQVTPAHLATIGSVDIALDTFPYNGQTTTCDCLWMGVPVIALEGCTHVSRVTAAILHRVGLSSLVASSIPDYVRCATKLAANPQELADLRSAMRGSIARGHLNDGQTLARDVEQAYREMWTRWCSS